MIYFLYTLLTERKNMDIFNNDFGKRLKAYREELGLTQIALAQKTNLSNQIISNLERGYTKTLSYSDLTLLANALECEPGDLMPKIDNYTNYLGNDVSNYIDHILNLLNSERALRLNGTHLDDQTRETLKILIDSIRKIALIRKNDSD